MVNTTVFFYKVASSYCTLANALGLMTTQFYFIKAVLRHPSLKLSLRCREGDNTKERILI